MLLNVLVPSSCGEPSPTRILLQEYKGLRGFGFFRHFTFSEKRDSKHTQILYIICIEIEQHFIFWGHYFGIFLRSVFWMHLVALSLLFGSVLASFGSPLAPFFLPLVPFWLPLVPFRVPFGSLQLIFSSLWVPFHTSSALQAPFGSFSSPPRAFWHPFGPSWGSNENQNVAKAAQVIPKGSKNHLPDWFDF